MPRARRKLNVERRRATARPGPRDVLQDSVDVSVIIPAHNEEGRLGATLDLYARVLASAFHTGFEIVVVSNGSTDDTTAITRAASHRWRQIRLIDVASPIGKGGAILEGVRRARGRRFVFTDADGATTPSSLLQLLEAVERHDVVIGSRRLPDSVITRQQPLHRRLFGRAFVLVVRALFGLPYQDTQCGAKAFRADIARQLAAVVQERHWTFDIDLLLTCREMGLDVREHPVTWADQPGSRLRLVPTLTSVVPSLWRLSRRYRDAGRDATVLPETQLHTAPAGEGSYEPTFAHSRL